MTGVQTCALPISAVKPDEGVTFGGQNGGLRLRGKNVKGTASSDLDFSTITFTNADEKVACTGDIRTLLAWDKYRTVDTKNARFNNLFENCTALTSAPELPAKTLNTRCYSYMFYGCSSLEVAPELPAEKLENGCYESMFVNCSSLKTAPELPATTLAEYCYDGMFSRCSSLEKAPELPATKLADYCYTSMFANCTKLSTVTMLAPSDQITSWENCVAYWLDKIGRAHV